MLNWIKKLITDKYVRSIVRGLVRALGGVLVGLGLHSADVDTFITAFEPIAVGLALLIVGQVFSLLEKKQRA